MPRTRTTVDGWQAPALGDRPYRASRTADVELIVTAAGRVESGQRPWSVCRPRRRAAGSGMVSGRSPTPFRPCYISSEG